MSLEKFPSFEDDSLEPLGISLEDVPEEIASKEKLSGILIEKLSTPGLPDGERESKMRQLRMIDQELGSMVTFLNREGGATAEIAQIEKLRDTIGSALAS